MALSVVDLYAKVLPRTNCRDCGFPTCIAFAGMVVSEIAGLGGATGRIVFGVEIQHDPAVPIVLEGMQLTVLVGEFELRCGLADDRPVRSPGGRCDDGDEEGHTQHARQFFHSKFQGVCRALNPSMIRSARAALKTLAQIGDGCGAERKQL